MITKIRIKRFRSINDLEINCKRITTFFGNNDVGKSNIVRALNLFFNSETDIGKSYSFERDYNIHASRRSNKADEIEIRLTFEIPKTLGASRKFSKEVEWTKIWRKDGYHLRSNEIKYTKNQSRKISVNGNLKAYLTRHRLLYAPAIKDRHFFSNLLGRIHDQLANGEYGDWSDLNENFNESLKASTEGLAAGLEEALGEEFTVSLPKDLKPIFSNLDIRNSDIPFDGRGDGIKVRHVPEMFNFLCSLVDEIKAKGKIRASHIWVFEEPENNLEMVAALELVQRIFAILEKSTNIQILITTHSPVFYSMKSSAKIGKIERYFVSYDKGIKHTSCSPLAHNEVASEIHVLHQVADALSDITKADEITASKVQEFTEGYTPNFSKPTIFVEGKIDLLVFTQAMKVFFPQYVNDVAIESLPMGGSHAVLHALLMWQNHSVASNSQVCCVGIIDDDIFINDSRRDRMIEQIQVTKLPKRRISVQRIHRTAMTKSIESKKYRSPVDLESLYSNRFWNDAADRGWLKEIENIEILNNEIIPENLRSEFVNCRDKSTVYAQLTDDEWLRVTHRFIRSSEENCKHEAAMAIQGMTNSELEEVLADFKYALHTALKFALRKS